MNSHLLLVREFHQQFGIAQPAAGDNQHLSDAEIVNRQGLLLQCGSEVCHAVSHGDLEKILAGLVDLAYNALAAIALRGDDVVAVTVNWRQDGSVLSMARVIVEKTAACISGETVHYSGLYALCRHLCKFFLNADFDTAFQLVHAGIIAQSPAGGEQPAPHRVPDLSSAFYE